MSNKATLGAKPHAEIICESFHAVSWHDSKLGDIVVTQDPKDYTHRVTIGIELLVDPKPGSYAYVPKSIEFVECALLFTSLDLDAKRDVSSDIATASCERADLSLHPMMRQINKREDLTEYYCFHFVLIPPAGDLLLVAKDFRLL